MVRLLEVELDSFSLFKQLVSKVELFELDRIDKSGQVPPSLLPFHQFFKMLLMLPFLRLFSLKQRLLLRRRCDLVDADVEGAFEILELHH